MIGPATICMACKHYSRDEEDPAPQCAAFTDRIPDVIFDGEVDHRQPYEGDNGITFELDEELGLEVEEDSPFLKAS